MPTIDKDDSKIDNGLNQLQLDLSNIRQRFESGSEDKIYSSSVADRSALSRSESIFTRLKRYQSAISGEKNMSGNIDNGSSSESYDNENDVVGGPREKEKIPFTCLSSLKNQWEKGNVTSNENNLEKKEDGTKEELFKLRQKVCLGRSASMKQVYERACNSPAISPRPNSINIETRIKAVSMKEKFEKGKIDNEAEEDQMERLKREKMEDLSVVVEAETAAREAKNLFKQIDASLSKNASQPSLISHRYENYTTIINGNNNDNNNNNRKYPAKKNLGNKECIDGNEREIIKCSDPNAKEEVKIETKQLQERYRFFECYKEEEKENRKFEMTPPRDIGEGNLGIRVEIIPNENVVKSLCTSEEIPKIDTTSKMLSKFKKLENQASLEGVPGERKPLKRFTPPKEIRKTSEKDISPERDPNIIRSSYKTQDIIPVEPKLARSLTAKFENWANIEVEKENNRNIVGQDGEIPQIDITKNLRAKFEAIKDEYAKPIEKSKPRVHRFVNELNNLNASENCSVCSKRLYPLEKLEVTGVKMHKNCFKCYHCSSSLRFENYTLAAGRFFCSVHFKQLFMSKGNYEEGFGIEQHKEKWKNKSAPSSRNLTPDPNELLDEQNSEQLYDQLAA